MPTSKTEKVKALKKGAVHEMAHSMIWIVCGMVFVVILLGFNFQEEVQIPWWIGGVMMLAGVGNFLLFLNVFLRSEKYADLPIKTKKGWITNLLSVGVVLITLLLIAAFAFIELVVG